MKQGRGFVLYADRDGWRISLNTGTTPQIHAVEGSAGATPAVAARLTAQLLVTLNFRPRRCIVALPTDACLCAAIGSQGLPARGGRRAMLYRLEEKLPVSAEEVYADFLSRGPEIFGVCTPRPWVDELTQSLAAEGMSVTAVSPAALLAFQGARRQLGESAASPCDLLLWQDESRLDLFSLSGGQPTGWISIPAEADDAALALASLVIARRSALRATALNVSDDLLARMQALPDVSITRHEPLSHVAAQVTAMDQILAGATPLIDLSAATEAGGAYLLRQLGAPLLASAASVVLLCLCLSIALLCAAAGTTPRRNGPGPKKKRFFTACFPDRPFPWALNRGFAAPRTNCAMAARWDCRPQVPMRFGRCMKSCDCCRPRRGSRFPIWNWMAIASHCRVKRGPTKMPTPSRRRCAARRGWRLMIRRRSN